MVYDIPIEESHENGMALCTYHTHRANVFLRRRLFLHQPNRPSGDFRMMDLPPELRTLTFEFALLLPCSGVWYNFKETPENNGSSPQSEGVWVVRRNESTAYDPNIWEHEDGFIDVEAKRTFRVKLVRHLALFRVSRQTYKQALPSYYSSNVFFFPDTSDMVSIFNRFSTTQLDLIRNVVWRRQDQPGFQKDLVE